MSTALSGALGEEGGPGKNWLPLGEAMDTGLDVSGVRAEVLVVNYERKYWGVLRVAHWRESVVVIIDIYIIVCSSLIVNDGESSLEGLTWIQRT
jgi:hypothetical protein